MASFPTISPIKGKEEVISELKKAAKGSEKVFLATDPDREGEAISWHLKELLRIPDDKTYRVTFNEITKRVVNESIASPRNIDMDLVDAQQARRILDRIVGYQLSPLLWKKDPPGALRRAGPVRSHPPGMRAGGGDPRLPAAGVLVAGRGSFPDRPQHGGFHCGLPRAGKENGAPQ
mgnify:CR=1 FL=1